MSERLLTSEIVLEGIDEALRQVVVQLAKNRIDGTMSQQKYDMALVQAMNMHRELTLVRRDKTGD